MTDSAQTVQRTYLTLTLFTTLSASFIWGINTLFLLDAGLDNTQAFTVNAFFTVGQVLFEIPTGVVADTRGRQFSFLLGAGTLMLGTLLYLVMWQVRAGLLGWAVASILLGLGFTFFSGATEAWLVDALTATGFRGTLESVFARAQVVSGVAMLTGSVLGGFIAQATNLGVPYLIRAGMLGLTFLIAWRFMHDIGFKPAHGEGVRAEVTTVLRGSIDGGLRNPPVRWLMLAAPFTFGRRDLRVLCLPAVPAPAVRRPDGVRRRRARRCRDRGCADLRRPDPDQGASPVQATDRCPVRGRRR